MNLDHLDLKNAALEFTRSKVCPPACVIQEAMEIGAALAIVEIAGKMKALNADMEQHRREIERGTVHGHNSGSLQV